MQVYLDNAATTPLDERVTSTMSDIMKNNYGNPSSIHQHGRESRTIVEKSRKSIAKLLNVAPGEIFFTSGGTEADNMAISCAIFDQNVQHIITSKIEHHAVLHTVERMESLGMVKASYVNLTDRGHVDLNHLESLLATTQANEEKTLVSLMHANNEIGNLLDLVKVGELCEQYGALFHSDTVQTIGHLPIDIKGSKADFITASGHKFNGPKGIGFIYVNQEVQLKPFIQGGSQERNMRGGTENIYGIGGLTKALEIAYEEMEDQREHVQGLKSYMMEQLEKEVPEIKFNGDTDKDKSLYTILNVSLPPSPNGEMILFNLDIEGVYASGGSACSSGSDVGSHVLNEIVPEEESGRINIRFSFGKYNTKAEIDYTIQKIKSLI